MPTKILFLSVRADPGGGPRHLLQILKSLRASGEFEIFLAAPLRQSLGAELSSNADHAFEIPIRSFSIKHFLKLLQFCRDENVELVHSHGYGAGIYSRLLKLFSGVKVVHTYHGLKAAVSIFEKIKWLCEWILSFLTDAAICVSQSEATLARELNLHPRRLDVIYNGLENLFFTEPRTRELDPLRIDAGVLARLSDRHKNISCVIKAFQDLPEPFHLTIAGDGEDSQMLRDLAAELKLGTRVKFIGNLMKPIDFLGQIDIYISAANFEGLPYSVLEAAALRVPCLLSDIGPHREILGEEGNYFDPGDPASLRLKLIFFSENAFKISGGGRRRLEDQFSVTSMIKQLIAIYRQI